MGLKVIQAALATIVLDKAARATVTQLFANCPVVANDGGMTLDMGTGPIVICTGKPSLPDEKSLRVALRQLNSKAKISRTNNIAERCASYAIATDASNWAKMFGVEKTATPAKKDVEDTAKPAGKKKAKKIKSTPAVDIAGNIPDGIIDMTEQTSDTPDASTEFPTDAPTNGELVGIDTMANVVLAE